MRNFIHKPLNFLTMRTNNFLRTLAAATLCAVMTTGAYAQLTTTGTTAGGTGVERGTATNIPNAGEPEAVDYATVGSIMPYSVIPDVDVASMVTADPVTFLPSEYNWRVDTDPAVGTNTATVAATDHANREVRAVGGAVLTNATTADNYTDFDIQIEWLTAGVYDMAVREQTRNSIGLPQCAGADSTLRVYVMPRPTIDWDETNFAGPQGAAADNVVGGCGIASTAPAGSTVNIPVNITSYTQDMKIAYSYQKYTMAGAVDGAAVTQTLVASANYGSDAFYAATPAAPNSEANVTLLTLTLPDADANAANRQAAYGKWEFTITAVNDLISRKSGVASQAADIPAGIFVLYSLPTPVTGAIRHVSNTGW